VGYAPARRKTGELIHPGLVPGGETGWAMLTAANPEPGSIDVGMFRFVAHEDPAWDWRTFDLDRDTSLIDKKADFIDAVNPDRSFGLVVGNFSSTTARTTAARVGRSRRRTASTITRGVGKDGAETRGLAETIHGTCGSPKLPSDFKINEMR